MIPEDRTVQSNPVIVVGMHRSGTSMLTRHLSELGVFMGDDCSKLSESLFFHKLNVRLLHRAGANWYSPAPMNSLLLNHSLLQDMTTWLEDQLCSREAQNYLGNRDVLIGIHDLVKPWGWKDPRNTLTLPIWLQAFPQAKVIHIVRNGIDVAQSLLIQDRIQPQPLPWPMDRIRSMRNYYLRYRGMIDPLKEPFSLKQAFLLWSEYLEFNGKILKSVNSGNMLELRYEDLLESPLQTIKIITQFVNLKLSQPELVEIASKVDPKRRFAFIDNPELLNFYETCRSNNMMKQYSYDSLSDIS